MIKARVGVDFNLDELPLADVVLISNTHYYFSVGAFAKLVDALRTRCRFVIVVSARAKRRRGHALWDYTAVNGYFKDYPAKVFIKDVVVGDDPSPRPHMYSVKFYGGLQAVSVDSIFDPWFEAAKKPGHKSHGLAPAMREYFEYALSDDGWNTSSDPSPYYIYWRKREPNKSIEWTQNYIEYKANLAHSIRIQGMLEPIYFDPTMKILDGLHRLVIAKVLGYDHVIARIL